MPTSVPTVAARHRVACLPLRKYVNKYGVGDINRLFDRQALKLSSELSRPELEPYGGYVGLGGIIEAVGMAVKVRSLLIAERRDDTVTRWWESRQRRGVDRVVTAVIGVWVNSG